MFSDKETFRAYLTSDFRKTMSFQQYLAMLSRENQKRAA
jgi:hypothetical protein